MSAFAESTFNSHGYNEFRPSYSDELFDTIIKYHEGGEHELALDIGCGSGQASYPLTKRFKKVIGTDISQVMIDTANEKITDEFKGKIEFRQSPAESLVFMDDESVDLVVAAECVHWLDHPVFFKEVHRILKPNGTLAFWAYADPVFKDKEEANVLSMDFTYEDPTKLGPYWEQPGRGFLRSLLKGIDPPVDLYTDLKVYEHKPNSDNASEKSPFQIKKEVPLEYYGHYVKTWSSYHKWKKENPDEEDIADLYIRDFETKFGWTKETKIILDWLTVMKLMKKK